jgi:hypothetical protein
VSEKKLSQPAPLADAEIDAVYEAVYPGMGALSRSSHGLATLLRDATAELNRLRAVIRETHARCSTGCRHNPECLLHEIEEGT